jgi:hypothetical protein
MMTSPAQAKLAHNRVVDVVGSGVKSTQKK